MKLTKSLLIATLACGTLWAQTPADQTAKPSSKNPTPAAKNAPPKTPAASAKHSPSPAPAPVKGTAASASPAKPSQKQAPAHAAAVPAKVPAAPAKPTAKTAVVATKPAAKPPVIVTKPAPKPAVVAKKPAVVPAKTVAKKTPPPPKKAAVASTAKVQPAAVKEHATATRTTAIGGKQRDPFVSPIVRTGGNLGSGCDTGKRCLVVDQIVLKGIVKSVSGYIAVVENPAKRAYFMRENDPVFNGKVVKITGDTVVFQEQTMDKVGKQSMREVVKKVNAPVV